MHNFSDFNITPSTTGFTGEKIKIGRVLNIQITVLGYKIEDSKYTDKRLDMQIEIDGVKRVTWTGSKILQDVTGQFR